MLLRFLFDAANGHDDGHAGVPLLFAALIEGEARGVRKTMLATAKRMLKDGILALKDIARYSGLSLAEVKELQASMA